MSGDVLNQAPPAADDLDVDLDIPAIAPPAGAGDVDLDLDVPAPGVIVSVPVAPLPIVEVLPADFPLPTLIRFVPNVAHRQAAEEAARYALSIDVSADDGLAKVDLALSALRTSLKTIDEHFEEPTSIAYDLHKRLTSLRGEWKAEAGAALKTAGDRAYAEERKRKAAAEEARRKAQEEADRQARELARRQAEEAERAKAPAPVVDQLKKAAETATAPPVPQQTAMGFGGGLSKSTTVERWKGRFVGTPADAEANPEMAKLTARQVEQVLALMRLCVETKGQGAVPLVFFAINWKEINDRASGGKATFKIADLLEAFDAGGLRAKGSRR